jgi:hypothetical protein
VLRRTFIHLITTSIGSHNGDDATKKRQVMVSVRAEGEGEVGAGRTNACIGKCGVTVGV